MGYLKHVRKNNELQVEHNKAPLVHCIHSKVLIYFKNCILDKEIIDGTHSEDQYQVFCFFVEKANRCNAQQFQLVQAREKEFKSRQSHNRRELCRRTSVEISGDYDSDEFFMGKFSYSLIKSLYQYKKKNINYQNMVDDIEFG